jgi:anti-sigma regulatory factor (Ser/Thr protein kinase)
MGKITIKADVYEYSRGIEFIIAQTAKTGIDTRALTKIKLMCEEIILASIRNAFAGGPGEIEIETSVKKGEYAIVISDDGNPYDALAQKPVSEKGGKTARSDLGATASLYRGAVDAAEYVRSGDRNVVTLRKTIG